MGQIDDTIAVYERLCKKRYKVTIENGVMFHLVFEQSRYHHLVGYQHLTDITDVSDPMYGKARFYRLLNNGKIPVENITKSVHFSYIAERIQFFTYIEEIVGASDCKIIVEFDNTKAQSDIEAKFFLYKREGNPLNKEPVTYYALFIGYDDLNGVYYPATYIVEHSKKYVDNQNMLDCRIEVVD